MGGESGTETDIGLLVGVQAKSSPIFALIGKDDFSTIFSLKSWCFLVFVNISSRWVELQTGIIFCILYFVFCILYFVFCIFVFFFARAVLRQG